MNIISAEEKVLERFRRLLALKRVGHAYLFVGPKESGKTQTALKIAQLVNCESQADKPCGQCPACRKIDSSNHPDVMVLEPEGDSIKIDQIRFLLGRLQLKAFEAKVKVFIIREVQTMTLEAANSLLKTLEEPATNTLMILTTENTRDNLDTICSRCHVVNFFSASFNRLRDVLGEAQSMARFFSVYTDGCLGRARYLAQTGFVSHKNEILDVFLHKFNEEFIKKVSQDKQEGPKVLQIFLSLIRDALLLKAGAPSDSIMHTDRLADVRTLAGRSLPELSAIYQQVVNTKKMMDENLNARMAFTILRHRIWDN